ELAITTFARGLLLKVAENCPIHKLLTSNITIQTELNI
ncbi:hypothetical protein ACOSB1_004021, partial [Acinetobacter baumannii]